MSSFIRNIQRQRSGLGKRLGVTNKAPAKLPARGSRRGTSKFKASVILVSKEREPIKPLAHKEEMALRANRRDYWAANYPRSSFGLGVPAGINRHTGEAHLNLRQRGI